MCDQARLAAMVHKKGDIQMGSVKVKKKKGSKQTE